MTKSQDVLERAKDTQSEMVMTLIDKQGNRRERALINYCKNYGNGITKSLTIFSAPADVKGTSFLAFGDKHKNEDQQWLYLPAMGRVRQISSSSKGDSFMGTEFTYYDMGTHAVDESTHTLLKEEIVDGQACFVIESRPKKPENYSKVVTWIRKDNFLTARADFFDSKGQYLKQGLFARIETIKGISTPTHITMKNAQNGRATILELKNIQYDTGLKDELFTQRAMQRGL